MSVRAVLLSSLVCLSLAVVAHGGPRGKVPMQHRAAAPACAAKPDPAEKRPPHADAPGCKKDAECTAGKNGRCVDDSVRYVRNGCVYDACVTDRDCGKGACTCDPQQGHYCSSGNCRVDGDCGQGGYCSPSYALCSLHGPYRPTGFYCHGAKDECTNDEDCPRPEKKGYGPTATRCVFTPEVGHWKCASQECPVG